MKSYLLFTATGPIVILTSYDFVKHPNLTDKLESKSIKKFVAHELSLELVKERYGRHFDIVRTNPHETDELRVLEYDGERVYDMFSFDELGPPIYYEPKNEPALFEQHLQKEG